MELTDPEPAENKVTLLILGAGWTYQFLRPALDASGTSYAATTTNGRDGTIPFRFEPGSDDLAGFKALPEAEYVLITFPLKGKGPSAALVRMYDATHNKHSPARYIQLGSTGIYTGDGWSDSRSPVDATNERGVAEDELIGLGGCVLNLAGLYGAQRQPGNWISRVAKTKEQLASKGALHLIHGVDVARAVLGVVRKGQRGEGEALFGRRWIVADCVSYDWWGLVWELSGETGEEETNVDGEARDRTSEPGVKTGKEQKNEEKQKYRQWVFELMREAGVKGLPRPPELLGRKLDARELWEAIGTLPERTLKR